MQFLRTLIWVLLAVILAAFAFNNWVSVPVRLWGGLIADVNLPLLLLVAFAIGFVPLYILHATARWRWKNRIATADRTISDLRAAALQGPAEPGPAASVIDPPVVEDGTGAGTAPAPTPPGGLL